MARSTRSTPTSARARGSSRCRATPTARSARSRTRRTATLTGSPTVTATGTGLRDSLQSNVATLPSTVAGDLGVAGDHRSTSRHGPAERDEQRTTHRSATRLRRALRVVRLPAHRHRPQLHTRRHGLPALAGRGRRAPQVPSRHAVLGCHAQRQGRRGRLAHASGATLTDGGIGDRDGLANGVHRRPRWGCSPDLPAVGGDTNARSGLNIPDSLQPGRHARVRIQRHVHHPPPPDGRLVNANGLTGRIADAADPGEGRAGDQSTRFGTGGGSGRDGSSRCAGPVVLLPPGQPGLPPPRERDRQPDLPAPATVVLDN